MSNVSAVPLKPVKRSYIVYLIVGIALACIAAFALARQGDDFLTRNARKSGVITTASGLQYQVLSPGSGAKPTDEDITLVQYRGQFLNGKVFDQSQRPTPMPVRGVVPGFSEALKLMSRGAKYRIWLPPKLGYGDTANGPIPPNTPLQFDLELIDFLPEAVVRSMQSGASQPGMPPQGMPPQGLPQEGVPQP